MRLILLALGLVAAPVLAQSYPSKVVRLLIPFSAGSGSDTIGRIYAGGMAEALEHEVDHINGMLYVRGHSEDYNQWRQLGCVGWSYDDVLPYFKKAENQERGGDEFHGTGGPLNVADQTVPSPINDAFLQACEQAGHKRVKDFNGAEQEGVGYYQVTQKNRERWSTASAYLRPAVDRNKNNVHVISNALVERIILDKNRAMGVRYVVNGQDEVDDLLSSLGF